jgi:hypothetical protein
VGVAIPPEVDDGGVVVGTAWVAGAVVETGVDGAGELTANWVPVTTVT